MSVRFRNLHTDPAAPVTGWPYEALVTAIERGGIRDWARITAEIAGEPWGDVSRQVEDYLTHERPYGVGPLLRRAVDRARRDATQRERETVAEQVRALVARSGVSRAEFASRIGTSRPRLSTYCTGSVTPSAALVERMRALVERMSDG